ncbi:MAG: TIGR01777 family oxidoreductase [Rubrobacteraceae bacterium]
MNVLVSGAGGLIGSALVPALENEGHRVIRLTHSEGSSEDTVNWEPSEGRIDDSRLGDVDVTVHLAGENIMGRWTPEKKRKILDSRTQGTRLLASRLARMEKKPSAMVCASATGYYGDRGDEVLREDSEMGYGFLPQVVREWERATEPARTASIRVVNLRFGIVLSPDGGALGTTLPIFKLGGGGKIGSGEQWWSWVALDDIVGAILHALRTDSLEGPANVTAPNPLTNTRYTKTLGRVLNRPTFFAVPAAATRIAFGEVADALLLASARVEPAKLQESGYRFLYPELEGAFRHLLNR